MHVWDRAAAHVQALDLGKNTKWCLRCVRTQPDEAYGFTGVVVSLKDLSGVGVALAPQ